MEKCSYLPWWHLSGTKLITARCQIHELKSVYRTVLGSHLLCVYELVSRSMVWNIHLSCRVIGQRRYAHNNGVYWPCIRQDSNYDFIAYMPELCQLAPLNIEAHICIQLQYRRQTQVPPRICHFVSISYLYRSIPRQSRSIALCHSGPPTSRHLQATSFTRSSLFYGSQTSNMNVSFRHHHNVNPRLHPGHTWRTKSNT